MLESARPRLRLAFCLALLLGACSKSPQEARDAFMAKGDQYFKEHKFQEAGIEYRKALQQDPRFAVGYLKLGDASAAADDPKGALSAYVRASDLAPDNIDINIKAGNLLLVARRFQDAKTRARNILTKDPKSVAGLVMLGNSLAGLQSLDEAVEVARRAAELDPSRAGLLGNLGVFELVRGNPNLAEKSFQRAVEVAPNSIAALMGLANFYHTMRRYSDAEAILRRALKLGPDNVRVNSSLASVLMEAGRAKDAEPYMRVATNAAGTTDASLAFADYYVSVGRIADAMALLEKIGRTKEGYSAARIRRAMIDYASGHRESAHKALREVLAQEPKNAPALALEARLLLAENRYDDAAALVNTALQADPRSPHAHFALAKLQLVKGAVEDARKSFVEVLNIDPSRTDAQLELSRLHLARREIDTAISYAQAAIKNDDDNIEARGALIRALSVRPEDLPRADFELKTLLTRYPNSPEVQSMFGVVALQRGDKAQATRAFEKALVLDPDLVEAVAGLAAMDAEAGRFAAARARVEARLQATSEPTAELLLLASKVYVANRQLDKAEAMLRRIIDLDSSNLEAFNLLGRYLVVRGKLPEARRQFEELVKKDPRSVSAQTMLGLLAKAQGDTAAAKKAYEAAIRVDPQTPTAANNLAWLYANTDGGNLDLALQLAQTAHAKIPASAQITDTLAFVYYKKEMGSFAVPLLAEALDQEPNNPEYHYHLGLVYAQAGEDAKARKSLQAALKINPQFSGADHARRIISTLVY